MDRRLNPYSPGAGTPPPELAGRDDLISRADVALDRIRNKRGARSFILYGLRGVGKTVLLNRIRNDAEANGFVSAWIEAPEDRSLPAALIPTLRASMIRISRLEHAKDLAERSLRVIGSFAKSAKIRFQDIEFGFSNGSEQGIADSGDLDHDLTDLIVAIGETMARSGSALVIYIDELQYVAEAELAALISALHRANQRQLPVTMMAAGLPQLLARMGRAKSYAERLFEFAEVDRLSPAAAREALCIPARKSNVEFEPEAVDEIIRQTQGYPYFLQEWGKHSWDIATAPPITAEDARSATMLALAELDASFFRVRFDRLTPTEKRYVRAMAELGPGPHRSGDIAERLEKKVTTVAPVRNALIEKGMIYSPSHGDTAFTVPLFDGFMMRTMP